MFIRIANSEDPDQGLHCLSRFEILEHLFVTCKVTYNKTIFFSIAFKGQTII